MHVTGLLAASVLVPLFVPIFDPAWRIPEFSPRQIIYAKDVFPLVLAPWATPTGVSRAVSRLAQAALLLRLPTAAILPCYAHWVVVGLLRTLTGFLLTRSVGWAYPRMFNHWALYETSSGIGPALVVYLLTSGARPTLDVVRRLSKSRYWESARGETILVACACSILCWFDNAPWTYTMAVLLSVAWTVGRAWLPLPPSASHESAYIPLSSDAQTVPNSHARRPRLSIQTCLIVLLTMPLPSMFTFLFNRSAYPHMPPSLTPPKGPLLEILILTFPRPNDDAPGSTSVLSQTISSYLPYIDDNKTSLSVFTHARVHPSFEHAKQEFRNSLAVFYADPDSHLDSREGQYLHVAEAFRWAYEGRGGAGGDPNSTHPRAEWVMLVEDDFPLCGEWGWRGIVDVMNILENGRTSRGYLRRRGGFVGTGGSGLIIHYSVLPILSHILRIHSSVTSPLPAGILRRPVDIIIQDCLVGIDPLCPAYTDPQRSSSLYNTDSGSLVITSKLVMDHIGGDKSTFTSRQYSAEKWRCGWRHAFHGRGEVFVVPV
ncbi:hypothetical protein V8B97DRAFT_2025757 [Scleroderma yunnanense]